MSLGLFYFTTTLQLAGLKLRRGHGVLVKLLGQDRRDAGSNHALLGSSWVMLYPWLYLDHDLPCQGCCEHKTEDTINEPTMFPVQSSSLCPSLCQAAKYPEGSRLAKPRLHHIGYLRCWTVIFAKRRSIHS